MKDFLVGGCGGGRSVGFDPGVPLARRWKERTGQDRPSFRVSFLHKPVVREGVSRIFPLTSLPRHEKMIYTCRYIILNGQPKTIPPQNHVPQNDVEPAESTDTTLPPQYRCVVEQNAAHNLQRLCGQCIQASSK
jgi:hypothetical protein